MFRYRNRLEGAAASTSGLLAVLQNLEVLTG
jgi:hypothetical protein